MTKITISGELPGMNEIINANRNNRYAGASQKKKFTNLVAWECKAQGIKPIGYKVDVEIHWYCKNKRKDKDNISCGMKFLLDGLMTAGVIPNDGWNEIGDINHRFFVDKDNPRVEMFLMED